MKLTIGDYVKTLELLPELQRQLTLDARPFASLPLFSAASGCWIEISLHRDGVLTVVPDDAFPKMVTPAAYYKQESSRKLYQDLATPTAHSTDSLPVASASLPPTS